MVDDGSPDSCPKLCDEYAREDNRVKVIHKENGGLSDARNAGLKQAIGDYILYVDSDDYIDLDACERFVMLHYVKKLILSLEMQLWKSRTDVKCWFILQRHLE